ncbi:MAG: hemerythrin domain-containing protein [Alphaproteobacteria bacterium]|nr:hemerythrin domain-containing protein [Alphaproteobacteria bacterium]
MDITELIQHDHEEQRRLFGILQQIPDEDRDSLQAVWRRLRAFLEAHARAEELHFYPSVLRRGRGGGDSEGVTEETRDAISDHNEIRDKAAQVGGHDPGSAGWRAAVSAVEVANSKHMSEEERQVLADFRLHADLDLRHRLAIAFAAFEADHVDGVEPKDLDPAGYVRSHAPH